MRLLMVTSQHHHTALSVNTLTPTHHPFRTQETRFIHSTL